MTEPAASALDAFRAFNFERIYLRPAALPPGRPRRSACSAASSSTSPTHRCASPRSRAASVAPVDAGSAGAAAWAVRYVSGMTDRFALGLGVELLGWRPDDLPRGV